MNYNKLREFLADMEHQQWQAWSETLNIGLLNNLKNLAEEQDYKTILTRINERQKRWKKLWKPYNKLNEEQKDQDREWADKILNSLPFKCPIHQCGGFMVAKERKMTTSFLAEKWEHWNGDEQSPDLICTNCKAVYQFQRFKDAKIKSD